MTRIPPSQQLAPVVQQLRDQRDGTELSSALLRANARKTMQELLKAEVTERLGRVRYERRESGAHGYRNGCDRRHLDTAERRLEIDLSQVSDTESPYQTALWQTLQRRTEVIWVHKVRLNASRYRGLACARINELIASAVSSGLDRHMK